MMINYNRTNIFFSIIVFLVISVSSSFVLTSPSDPLQYVSVAISNPSVYPFLDRLFLYFTIGLFSKFINGLEYIGGITTLSITTCILISGTFWLNKIFGLKNSLIFSILFICSPMILGISSYTYPTQLLSLLILLSVFIIYFFNIKYKFIILGIFYILIIFTKVQGFAFIILLLFLILKSDKITFHFCQIVIGFLFGIIILILFGKLVNNNFNLIEVFIHYFSDSGDFSPQFKGRGEVNTPPFYLILLNPVTAVSIYGLTCPLFNQKYRNLRIFSYAGFTQLFGLITIYLISHRGGPLIPNYLLDTYILGLVPFSIILADNFKIKVKNLILLLFFILLLSTLFIFTPAKLFLSGFEWGIQFSYQIIPIYLLFFIISFPNIKILYKNNIILICFLILISNIYYGLSDGSARRNWSIPYHNSSIAISKINSINSIDLITRFNTFDYEDGSWRLKSIYSNFYEKNNINNIYINSFNKNMFRDTKLLTTSTIVTDSPFITFHKLNYSTINKITIAPYENQINKKSLSLPIEISKQPSELNLFLLYESNCESGASLTIKYFYNFKKFIRVVNCDPATSILDISQTIPLGYRDLEITYNNLNDMSIKRSYTFSYMILSTMNSAFFPLLLIDKERKISYLKNDGAFSEIFKF